MDMPRTRGPPYDLRALETTLVLTIATPRTTWPDESESQCLGWGGRVPLVVVWVGGSPALLCVPRAEPTCLYFGANRTCPEDAARCPKTQWASCPHAPHCTRTSAPKCFSTSRTIFVRPRLARRAHALCPFAPPHSTHLQSRRAAHGCRHTHWELGRIPPWCSSWPVYWHRTARVPHPCKRVGRHYTHPGL